MENDKYLKLLNKLAKLFRAKEVLENRTDLDEFEQAVLQRIEVGAEICIDTLEALDELWEVYEERPEHRPEVKKVIEQSKSAEKKEAVKSNDDGLALGVGMAAGGIFDYLKSPENVEKVETSEKRGVELISDEELEALEKEAEELDITQEREDLDEALHNLTDNQQEQLVDTLEDLGVYDEVEAYEEGLADITDIEGGFF